MTRAASGAQRSGAAVLYLMSRSGDLPLNHEYCVSSFCVSRTPARWQRGILWARRGGLEPPGSAVPTGSGGRTGKRLILPGSVVPFRGPSRDAQAGGCRRMHYNDHQNHRTTELQNLGERDQWFSGSASVLRFRPTKQWAGYSLRIPRGLDQGLIGGGVRRKFRGSRAPAGRRGGGARIDGFAWVSGAARGRVGMAMLERAAKTVPCQWLARSQRNPTGLTGGRLYQAPSAPIATGHPTPPNRPRSFPSPLALTAFWIWADARSGRCSTRLVQDSEGPQTSNRQMGLGVRASPRVSTTRCGMPWRAGRDDRVGDAVVSCVASGRSGGMRNVRGRAAHVN